MEDVSGKRLAAYDIARNLAHQLHGELEAHPESMRPTPEQITELMIAGLRVFAEEPQADKGAWARSLQIKAKSDWSSFDFSRSAIARLAEAAANDAAGKTRARRAALAEEFGADAVAGERPTPPALPDGVRLDGDRLIIDLHKVDVEVRWLVGRHTLTVHARKGA